MKRIILASCLTLLAGSFAFSQADKTMGVGTDNPKGPLHIDAQKNTSADGTTNTADDVIVNSNGNLGVGTAAPVDKVHIVASTPGTGLRLNDGSQGESYMLMSKDAVGTGIWVPKPFYTQEGALIETVKPITGTGITGGQNIDITATNGGLFLAPGTWLVMAKYATQDVSAGDADGFYFWTYLHDLDDVDPATTPNRRTPTTTGAGGNQHYYLNANYSFTTALSVAGLYPEQTGGKLTTPTLSYVATIKNTFNKKPGQDGYLHELRLTFSSSTTRNTNMIRIFTGTVPNFDLGKPYLFAIRLDVDPSQF